MDLNELRRKRATLVNEARKLLDTAEAEKRELTGEEQQIWDRHMEDVDKYGAQIEREERLQSKERDLGQSQHQPIKPEPAAASGTRADQRSTEEYRATTLRYIRAGRGALAPEEYRALQADSPTLGGYIRPAQQFVVNLIKTVDDMVFMRNLATVIQMNAAESLGAPALDNNPADADWTSEIATGSEDSTMSFGKRELHPHPLAKRLKVSNKLLSASVLDVEALVRDRLAYKFGISQEKGFLTGSGANQPLGVFTASANGISTSRDVSTGNTTTAIQGDGLIEAKYSLKAGYLAKARWIFHRDAVKGIRKLKDGNGDYLWKAGLASDKGDTILDLPYLISEYAPNTFTTGLYVGIVGDFSYFWIADALDLAIKRLDELYAESNQVGFIGRWESDGMPVLEEAFARVKLA